MFDVIRTAGPALAIVLGFLWQTGLHAEEKKQDPPQPGQAANQKGGGCESIPKPKSAGSASIVQREGDSLQRKSWEPVGGEIQFTVRSFEGIAADASIIVCFRWKLTAQAQAGLADANNGPRYVEAPVSKIERNGDGTQWKVTTAVPDLDAPPAGVERSFSVRDMISFVPLAEARIIAIGTRIDDKTTPRGPVMDVTTTIGITALVWALLFAAGTVVLGCWILHRFAAWRLRDEVGLKGASWPLRIIATPTGYASLSQFQIVLWTFVVAASAVYVMCLSGELITITNGTLVLLGIAGAAALGAKAHSENQSVSADAAAAAAEKDKNGAEDLVTAKQQALKVTTDPAELARLQVESQVAEQELKRKTQAAVDTAQKARDLKTSSEKHKPQWSDLIVTETVAADGMTVSREVDVARFQMLLFTLVTAVFVVTNVLTTYVIPEISTGFLTLMGISNGVYIGSKVVQRS